MSPQTQSVPISTAFSQTCVPTCTAIQGKHTKHTFSQMLLEHCSYVHPFYRTHPDPLK